MAGLLSKNITLSYADSASGSFKTLTNLQAIPDLGATDVDKVETTVLTDAVHTFIKGLGSQGDSVAFTFLYEKDQFLELCGLGDAKKYWKVTFPDGLVASFSGQCTAGTVGVTYNQALTYTLSIVPEDEITFA